MRVRVSFLNRGRLCRVKLGRVGDVVEASPRA